YVFSVQAHLLPYIEGANLYNLIDFKTAPNFGTPASPMTANETAARTKIAVYQCPSDRVSVPNSEFGVTNYVATTGNGVGGAASIRTGNGVMYSGSNIRFADVRDGLSSTVVFSEQTLGTGGRPSSAGGGPPTSSTDEVLELVSATPTTDASCVIGASGSTWSGLRGAKWMNGHYGDTMYNHYYSPNSRQFDCGNASHNFGLTAARSVHTGGVHVLLGGGGVRFVSENINLDTWRAIGTRDGREVPGEF
ncbi:MAG: DUF1559 domain-containing protein, partial [Planctomycetota bacterium]|nr:DUF1559 domain-containing protein [Planctomycetota bacterium]